jgi:hypothetical protein
MKFWKLLRWGGFIAFLLILMSAWGTQESRPPSPNARGDELPAVPTIR